MSEIAPASSSRISDEQTYLGSLIRFKRHDPLRLAECMKELGWDPLDGWRYGDEPGARLLYLFRRRET
jgi:hypothetical protein